MTPKVSVCITFCDKDFHLIKTLLSHIENNIKVSYEVLLYDNREKDNSDLDIHNYEILGQNGKNEFQLKAKSELIKNAKGEYIWFVDADDDICFIPKRLESLTFNIVSFGAYFGKEIQHTKSGIFKINYDNTIGYTGGQLWDKWIKSDLLKQFVDIIKDKEMICGEDVFLYILALEKEKLIEYNPTIIYKYNLENSSSYSRSYKGFESFKGILKRDRLKDMAYKYCNNNWLKETKFDLYLEHEPVYLFNFLKKDNKDDWKKLADEITQRYSEQELLISYSVFFDTNIWYKDGFKFIKKYLIEKYPNAFTNQNIIATQKLYNKTQVFIRFEKEEEEI